MTELFAVMTITLLAVISPGAAVSAVVVLPLAWPLHTSGHDLTLLGGLGLLQLAVPCLIAVNVSRYLAGPEMASLGQLEVLFGVLWAWLLAGENPTAATIIGGSLVLAALVGNELLAWRANYQNKRSEA